jgi:hypothetical protein
MTETIQAAKEAMRQDMKDEAHEKELKKLEKKKEGKR